MGAEPRREALSVQAPTRTAGSQRLDETIVGGMCADPKPDHVLSVPYRQRAIAETDPSGPNTRDPMDRLETDAGMTRIGKEAPVGLARPTLDILGQLGESVAELPRGS